MAVIKHGSQEFQPYARLMNIIGDQLITDKKVAVIEIIKNCYDADAEKVSVRFKNLQNYGKSNLPLDQQASIEIEDDGEGMTIETIQSVWLRPATPNKLQKKSNEQSFTKKGRIIQGEKGVGRFAIHKLGESIVLYTKSKKEDEVKLNLNFGDYNPEGIEAKKEKVYKLLKDVQNYWTVENPSLKIEEKGTLILITDLRENWTEKDLNDLSKNISKLIPPTDPLAPDRFKIKSDFKVTLTNDGHPVISNLISFGDVISDAPFQLSGYISEKGTIDFKYNSVPTGRELKGNISLLDKTSLKKYNYDLFSVNNWFSKRNGTTHAGSIWFSLYAYDLNNRDKTLITKDKNDFIKENFVYVFRDSVRVYPFGEKEYDWLELDKLRAVQRAGDFPSYNDLIGFIYISQESNPMLKDATNRQGMMNIDGAYDDFRYSILATAQILNVESKIDKEKRKLEKERTFNQSSNTYRLSYDTLKKSLSKIGDVEILQQANKFLDDVDKHTSLMKDRMSTVEDLAGLGMAVERASHDSLAVLSNMRRNIKFNRARLENNDLNENEIVELFNFLDDSIALVYDELQIIQPLFKIQRKTVTNISIGDSIEKVIKYFRRDIEGHIEIKKEIKDFTVKTNQGLILQVLINLVDNAIYWVKQAKNKDRVISLKVDRNNNTLIIADNGPGIRPDVVSMIFTEFFSLKSDGRGLGLYIAAEILFRVNAQISVIQEENKKLLPGANFIIYFNTQE